MNTIRHFYSRYLPKSIVATVAMAFIVGGIRLFQTGGALAEFAGAFLLLSGAQIALWVVGIRLELLGNTIDTIDASPGKGQKSLRPSVREIPFTPFDQAIRTALVELNKAEAMVKGRADTLDNDLLDRISNLSSRNPALVALTIMGEIERAVQQHTPWLEQPSKAVSDRPLVYDSVEEVYRSFRELRNSVVHDRSAPMDERTTYELADIGLRLLRLLRCL